MGLSGLFVTNTMTRAITRAGVLLPEAMENRVLDVAIEALEYAKQNAPWNDRTGDARDGLDTDVDKKGAVIVWELFHTVEYGLWLETIKNGEFAIIMPTLEMFAPMIGQGLDESGVDYAQ